MVTVLLLDAYSPSSMNLAMGAAEGARGPHAAARGATGPCHCWRSTRTAHRHRAQLREHRRGASNRRRQEMVREREGWVRRRVGQPLRMREAERGVWARNFIFHYILKAGSGLVGPEDG